MERPVDVHALVWHHPAPVIDALLSEIKGRYYRTLPPHIPINIHGKIVYP